MSVYETAQFFSNPTFVFTDYHFGGILIAFILCKSIVIQANNTPIGQVIGWMPHPFMGYIDLFF